MLKKFQVSKTYTYIQRGIEVKTMMTALRTDRGYLHFDSIVKGYGVQTTSDTGNNKPYQYRLKTEDRKLF